MSPEYNRTFLSIDYGKRRIGLAKSDPLGIIASPFKTIEVKSRREAVQEVAEVIVETQPNAVVIGYPRHVSGDRSPMCDEIDKFLTELSVQWSGPVHKVDEEYSSSEAVDLIRESGKRPGKQKGKIDTMAAVVILKRFLDEHAA